MRVSQYGLVTIIANKRGRLSTSREERDPLRQRSMRRSHDTVQGHVHSALAADAALRQTTSCDRCSVCTHLLARMPASHVILGPLCCCRPQGLSASDDMCLVHRIRSAILACSSRRRPKMTLHRCQLSQPSRARTPTTRKVLAYSAGRSRTSSTFARRAVSSQSVASRRDDSALEAYGMPFTYVRTERRTDSDEAVAGAGACCPTRRTRTYTQLLPSCRLEERSAWLVVGRTTHSTSGGLAWPTTPIRRATNELHEHPIHAESRKR
ncbi:hypothetical protein OH77DRAFT_1026107 [Trametes cingulata]|nr:hypothetical protein OH77DRAFT_1026107 [Trametes cingulata]